VVPSGDTVSTPTQLSGLGLQVVEAAPVAASTDATLGRSAAPILAKVPPSRTRLPVAARASTAPPLGAGFQPATAPVPASTAATRLRESPPMWSNSPPT